MHAMIDKARDRTTWRPLLTALLGMLLLAALTAGSLHSGNSLFSLGGLAIVFGGVTAVAFMSFSPPDVCQALRAIAAMLQRASVPPADLRRDIEAIVRWSRVIADKGTRGLESSLAGSDNTDPFVRYGLDLVVSDYVQQDVRAMLETAAQAGYQRACAPAEVLRAMAGHAPAFGMVGTLLGMVSMLHGLGSNTDAIGEALAVAFLSTLYGVLSARLIYMPAAARVERQAEALRLREAMITEGLALLAANKSPMFIRDRLHAFVQPKERDGSIAIAAAGTSPRASATPRRAVTPHRLQVVKG